MDERGSSRRVAYLGPAEDETRRSLAAEGVRVEPVADRHRLQAELAAVDCVVVPHDPPDADAFEVLETVRTAAVDRPVVVVAAPDVASTALEAGATEVLSAEPADAPASLLARRIEQAVVGTELVKNANALTQSVLNTLSDVVYVLETDGSFRQWNDRLLDVTVYDESALGDQSLPDLVVPDDREILTEAIEDASTDGVTETREAALLTAVGDRVTYEFSITPLTENGTVEGLAGTAREVTERKLREQRLAVLTRVLRHNVRNRMTVVQGHAEQLESTIGADQSLDAIAQAASELVALSDKARRVEAALRESSANRRALDVVAVAETTMAALAREFPDADLTLRAPDSASARTTDGLMFVIEELVRNGIVHNDSEPPRVEVAIQREDTGTVSGEEASPAMIAITVRDNGPGIPETERVALTTGRETDLEHATGLGLWLVNWVVTAAGGDLVCGTCDELGGAEVTLRFPSGEH